MHFWMISEFFIQIIFHWYLISRRQKTFFFSYSVVSVTFYTNKSKRKYYRIFSLEEGLAALESRDEGHEDQRSPGGADKPVGHTTHALRRLEHRLGPPF
jgi:hypothetical protein